MEAAAGADSEADVADASAIDWVCVGAAAGEGGDVWIEVLPTIFAVESSLSQTQLPLRN